MRNIKPKEKGVSNRKNEEHVTERMRDFYNTKIGIDLKILAYKNELTF